MLEINEEVPFLWRLSSENDEGFSLVSMVIPFNAGSQNLEHTIQTDVVSFNGDDDPVDQDEILEWNEDDISLFLKLLATKEVGEGAGHTRTFRVDLTDPETIEIVHIVAAAGFGMALAIDDLLVADPGATAVSPTVEHDVGIRVTLPTVDGYKRAVVVGNEEEEVVCVLLDPIRLDGHAEMSDIHTHDLVVVKSHQLLPSRYSSVEPAPGDVLH